MRMKSLWNVVSFLAVVNLLAFVMLIVWLWQSDRLSHARVQQLREMLSLTITEEKSKLDEAMQKAQADAATALNQQIQANPSVESVEQLRQITLIRYEQEQARRRLEDERNVLLTALATESSRLEEQRSELEQQKAAWENAVRQERQRKNDEQFLQTVRQFEQLPPKQGKQMIMELIDTKQRETVVAYLDAMSPRACAKILKEFKTEPEIKLATELLEQLRTFGLESSGGAPLAAVSARTDQAHEATNGNDRRSIPSTQ
jgi:hypothetical protein